MAKESERRLVTIARRYNWYTHKYGDIRKPVCFNCKKTVDVCPLCAQEFILPKTENVPDFAVGLIYTYVECKNSDSTGRWAWAGDIGPKGSRRFTQRKWLLEHKGWLFIELGNGRAPEGKSAYLIYFRLWVNKIEPILLKNGMKSIRKEAKGNRPGADELLAEYALEWVPNEEWEIPLGHIWWKSVYGKLLEQASIIREKHLDYAEFANTGN